MACQLLLKQKALAEAGTHDGWGFRFMLIQCDRLSWHSKVKLRLDPEAWLFT